MLLYTEENIYSAELDTIEYNIGAKIVDHMPTMTVNFQNYI